MNNKKYISINYKLVMFLFVLLTLILGVGLIINKLFYYDYYLNTEKETIYEFAKDLDNYYENNINIEDFVEEFLLTKKANLYIYSPSDLVKPENVFQDNIINASPGKAFYMQKYNSLPENVLGKTQEEGYYFFIYNINHQKLDASLLALSYELKNDNILLITLPFEELSNTANIAIKFNAMIAIISLIIGMLLAYIFSKKITKPIIELSIITENISNLNFSQKYEVSSNDEIRVLGESINDMSKRLEESLFDLKNANIKLIEDIKEKDRLVEIRKEFIATISHELKTPVALIMGYVEGLKENIVIDQNKKEYYLDVIKKESKHMDYLVRDLLNLTELEYDTFKLSKKNIDLSSLIDEVLDRYVMIINSKKIKIILNKEDIVMVEVDKKRIEQAFSNLVLNALEYTPNEGSIKITVAENEMSVKLSIENSGSEILKENLSKIWTSFYKQNGNFDRKIGGSGIGLSIVRAVIEKHNGKYGVENTDNGVLFWFELIK